MQVRRENEKVEVEDEEIKELKINTLTKLFILMLLYEGPKYGYELMKSLRSILPFRINPEQVYPFLKTLRERKLARVTEISEREKKIYELTEKGRETVEMLLKRFSNLIQIAITPQVNVCANCGVKIIGEGYKEEIDGEILTFCCKHCAKHYKETKLKLKK